MAATSRLSFVSEGKLHVDFCDRRKSRNVSESEVQTERQHSAGILRFFQTSQPRRPQHRNIKVPVKLIDFLTKGTHQPSTSTGPPPRTKPVNTMLFNNMEVHSRVLRPTPAWSLDYKKCTIAELCKFLEERTGDVLDEAQLQKVRDHGSYPLIDRLREMDRERTFPRFMELPPELRIGVYENLLVTAAGNNKHRGMPSIHTAVLRTSRQVYSEARPVLYKRNKFWAVVRHAEAGSRHSGAPIVGCSL